MTPRKEMAVETLKATIRQAGLRSTAPRVSVLRHLAAIEAPVSHGELTLALESQGIDRTTLYRNLSALTEAGLVRRSDLGDHVWRFELKGIAKSDPEHPHFTCTDCGTVECLPEVTVQVRRGERAPKALGRHEVEVQLRGLCDDCA